jgi:hypothetical protein
MPTLDIFNNDAFSLVNATKAINDVPHQPGRIGELGYFSEEGITTATLSLEQQGTSIALVPAGQRGSSGTIVVGDKRKIIPIQTIHLPQRAAILADEVQGLRAFGTDSELETVQNVFNKRLVKMRRNIDTTIEYQRMGAIKGQVLDSDGSTVILDLFNTFGVSQTTHAMLLSTPTTKVRNKVVEAKRKIETALGALPYSGLRVLCSASFFDALVGHAAVEDAFDRWMNGDFLRQDQRGGFYYAGVFWEEYRGQIGSVKFIADDTAYMIPEGVPDLFVTNFAPADYMETANTIGLPYYAKQEAKPMNKGIDIESQSNPISICTRPAAIAKLTIA